jgi:hypothetical protein
MMDTNTRFISRAMPGLLVVALLALAAAAPRHATPSGVRMPAPPPSAAPCSDYTHVGGGDSVAWFAYGDGVVQPLPQGITAAGCSLSVTSGSYAYLRTSVSEWDPATLAPDPQTVALRTEDINPSGFSVVNGGGMPWLTFVPPLVTRALAGVAEPPRPTVAVQVSSTNVSIYSNTYWARYAPAGDPQMPAAAMLSAGGTHGTLLGSHPVVAHALCTDDAELQSLRIAQSVRRTDATLVDQPAELVQSFRVPQPVELRWVELAVAGTPAAVSPLAPEMPSSPPPPTLLAIVDPNGAPVPPETMPSSMIEAVFGPATWVTYFASAPTPRWASHLDFDHTITLQPGRDYWLYLRDATRYTFLARKLTGSESGDFTAGVGPLVKRGAATDPWTPVRDTVLAFKIVGMPAATTPVPPHRLGFLVRVAPNPANGVAQVLWSGAVGPVRLEVYDARGRHVATGSGGAAGNWSLGAPGTRPLAPGVYFLRARDSQNQGIDERFVVVK